MAPPTVFIPGSPGGGPIEFKEYGFRVEFLIPLWQCGVMGYAIGGAISGILITIATIISILSSNVAWWTAWWGHLASWGHIVLVTIGGLVTFLCIILRFGQEVISPYFDAGWITKWISKNGKSKPEAGNNEEMMVMINAYLAARASEETRETK